MKKFNTYLKESSGAVVKLERLASNRSVAFAAVYVNKARVGAVAYHRPSGRYVTNKNERFSSLRAAVEHIVKSHGVEPSHILYNVSDLASASFSESNDVSLKESVKIYPNLPAIKKDKLREYGFDLSTINKMLKQTKDSNKILLFSLQNGDAELVLRDIIRDSDLLKHELRHNYYDAIVKD
jgi:hypothetical protein